MNRGEAARRYLQASKAAGTTGLPDDARAAHEETMERLERRHPGVSDLAVTGAPSDFDRPLSKGEREHQLHLRQGASANELKGRREAARRGPSSPSSSSSSSRRSSKRQAVRAGVAGGRGYARAQRTVLSSSGLSSGGSIVLQAIGVGVGLSLLYLVLSSNGSKAFSLLLGGITNAMRLFVGPYDPLNPPRRQQAQQASQIGPPSLPGGAVAASPVQRAKLNPKFGPAPGIGTPITPVGVAP